MRKFVEPKGFRKPYLQYNENVKNPERLTALDSNPFLNIMRRVPDPEVALRKHSEPKKPWFWQNINIMEYTVGEGSGINLPFNRFDVEDIEIPVTIPRPSLRPIGQPGGQPAVIPPDMGKAFIAWTVIKGSTVWGYVGNLVIYNHDNAYSFANADDFFSRVQLSPSPGWKDAGSADVGYFSKTDYTAGERRGGANVYDAALPYGEMWGVSRLIADGKRKFRAYWGIDYPPGTANNLSLITLASIRTGKVTLKIDGKEIPVIGQSILYRELEGAVYHHYWELNGTITAQLLYGDRLNYAYEEVAAVGYARLNIDTYYSQWSSGEHSD